MSKRLRTWREAKGMTLEELGAEIGVSGVAVGRYEAGRPPKADVLRQIILFTGGEVTANDWFDIPAGRAAE